MCAEVERRGQSYTRDTRKTVYKRSVTPPHVVLSRGLPNIGVASPLVGHRLDWSDGYLSLLISYRDGFGEHPSITQGPWNWHWG